MNAVIVTLLAALALASAFAVNRDLHSLPDGPECNATVDPLFCDQCGPNQHVVNPTIAPINATDNCVAFKNPGDPCSITGGFDPCGSRSSFGISCTSVGESASTCQYSGFAAPGESCATSFNTYIPAASQPENPCYGGPSCTAGICGGTGETSQLLAAGADCAESNQYCNWADNEEICLQVTGKCGSPVEVGQPCKATSDCVAFAFCAITSSGADAGTCVAGNSVALNGNCRSIDGNSDEFACKDGLYCDNFESGNSYQCKEPLDQKTRCEDDSDVCEDYETCVCTDTPNDKAECRRSDLPTFNGIAKKVVRLGQCMDSNGCYANLIKNGATVPNKCIWEKCKSQFQDIHPVEPDCGSASVISASLFVVFALFAFLL